MTYEDQTFPRPLKLTVDNFMALHEAGAFEGLSKVELIEGEMLTMSPQHRPHARVKSRLFRRIADQLTRLGLQLEPLSEATVDMSRIDAPEPDIVVTSAPEGDGLIPVASVELIIEVADASYPFDTSGKSALYAKHRVPEYWVVGIPVERIEQYWSPANGAYTQSRNIPLGEPVESVTIKGLVVATTNLI
jgi:Uma2 family endonuclease